jgi:hypothetical protein
LNGGLCQPHASSYSCECTNEFTGKNCEHLRDPCEEISCSKHGVCTAQNGKAHCVCDIGFTGHYCAVELAMETGSFVTMPPGEAVALLSVASLYDTCAKDLTHRISACRRSSSAPRTRDC